MDYGAHFLVQRTHVHLRLLMVWMLRTLRVLRMPTSLLATFVSPCRCPRLGLAAIATSAEPDSPRSHFHLSCANAAFSAIGPVPGSVGQQTCSNCIIEAVRISSNRRRVRAGDYLTPCRESFRSVCSASQALSGALRSPWSLLRRGSGIPLRSGATNCTKCLYVPVPRRIEAAKQLVF